MSSEHDTPQQDDKKGINKSAIFVIILVALALLSWLSPETFRKIVDVAIMIIY